MSRRRGSLLGVAWHWMLAAVVACPLACIWGAAKLPHQFHARNLQIPILSDGSMQIAAMCRIGSVRTDHRRMGLFRVRLLPVTIIEQARLELTAPPGTNFLASAEAALRRIKGGNALEFRDIAIVYPGDTEPRIQASRVRQNGYGSSISWTVEGLKLFSNGQTRTVGRGTISPHPVHGAVLSWHENGREATWDFQNGSYGRNQTSENYETN